MFVRRVRRREQAWRMRTEVPEREQRIRDICETQLQGVRVSRPLDIDQLCASLAVKRGRPLILHELPDLVGADAPCGLWLAFPDEDHIWHAKAVSQRQRTQVIKHEIGHVLLDHRSDQVAALLAALPPEIAPERVQRIFGRTSYADEREHDAELAASVLDEVIDNMPADTSSSWHSLVARADDALKYPRENRR
ncbi:secondary metabolite protein [Streptomyces sp. WAC 01529]|nr:secondary metabolite protein [Streptomyces sp. WAC 01529]